MADEGPVKRLDILILGLRPTLRGDDAAGLEAVRSVAGDLS